MTRETQRAAGVCSQCGSTKIRGVRRTRVHGDVVIENLPATWCPDCGEELYDAEVVDFVEKVLADPNKYSTWVPRRVARMA